MYMNLLLSRMTSRFSPNQGKRGEQAGRKGSGSGPPSKGKKKPISADKGINIVAM